MLSRGCVFRMHHPRQRCFWVAADLKPCIHAKKRRPRPYSGTRGRDNNVCLGWLSWVAQPSSFRFFLRDGGDKRQMLAGVQDTLWWLNTLGSTSSQWIYGDMAEQHAELIDSLKRRFDQPPCRLWPSSGLRLDRSGKRLERTGHRHPGKKP